MPPKNTTIKITIFSILFISTQIIAQNYLLGNWNGSRSLISDYGIDFEFVYTGEYFSNINGGIKHGGTYLDNFDITSTFDFNKIIGWNGAILFAYILGNNGGIPNDKVGSIQGISNIAAYNTWKLYQFWIEQQLFRYIRLQLKQVWRSFLLLKMAKLFHLVILLLFHL